MATKIQSVLDWVKAHRKTREKKEGLRLSQVRILYALHTNPAGLTYAGLEKATGVGEQAVNLAIGPLNPDNREKHNVRMHYECLLTLGFIEPEIKVLDQKTGEELVFTITKSGEKEYAKQYKEYGDKLPAPVAPAKGKKMPGKAAKATTPGTNGTKPASGKKPKPAATTAAEPEGEDGEGAEEEAEADAEKVGF